MAETIRRDAADPMLRLLEDAGLVATLRLLTTGQLERAALQAHAITLLSQETGPVAGAVLRPMFDAASIAATPYAMAAGVADLDGIAPAHDGPSETLLSDADWISLQNICNR